MTQLRDRGIRGPFRANAAGTHIVYGADDNGDESWRYYSIEIATRKTIPLTSDLRLRAALVGYSADNANEMVFAHNERRRDRLDLYRIDVTTGVATLQYANDDFEQIWVDSSLEHRLGLKSEAKGKPAFYLRVPGGNFQPLRSPLSDAATPYIVGREDLNYWFDRKGDGTNSLVEVEERVGRKRVLFQDPRADISRILHVTEGGPVGAVCIDYLKPEWHAVDPTFAPQLAQMEAAAAGFLVDRTLSADGKRAILHFVSDTAPATFHLYDVATGQARALFADRAKLRDVALRPMDAQVIRSRDGLDLTTYLTLPSTGARGVPLVINVHGGPHARDAWGFDTTHQWLANRGYAVLSVNFRGSTGFGSKFVKAGEGQWGAKMHDDIMDALAWAVARGVADPARVAIMGSSYGGYEVLMALIRDGDKFACGIDQFGVSNLVGMADRYRSPYREAFARSVGDTFTPASQTSLTKGSPFYLADKLTKPLLIAQGSNDPRVRKIDTDLLMRELRDRNAPVIYTVFADDGHGLGQAGNRLALAAITEAFLAKHLGGSAEPFGNALRGVNLDVRDGADLLPGLRI
ncbi:peptidase S9 [Rhodospirillales bacterium TMPK1]|uniref:Peptidase S9 n=1 Tax=Roseiterribacter gracilis TaxID=2812848 RepID=A0A8S8XJE4_9PROT|nr:peptidase S9 [Rhodospirillales bacterium TMPK1]